MIHMLVVDDDPGIRRVLSGFLTKLSYEVDTAKSGNEAWEKLVEKRYQLVITDMFMPDGTGKELLERIKTDSPWLPVIIITGAPEVDAAVDCMKNGAFDYISKPFDFDRIEAVVLRALEAAYETPREDHFQTVQARFSEDYDIQRILGEGNVGVVFQAIRKGDPEGTPVALKVLKHSCVGQEERKKVINRFMTEAQVTSGMDHPSIVRILDYNIIPGDDIPYLIMEYIDGKPLTHYIDRPRILTLEQKLMIVRQVADALAEIHLKKVVHRDVKPHNIMIRNDLSACLMDFGVAKNPDANLTITNQLVGSPAYLSPEGFGKATNVDHRSDIFSLGIVAYELLLGQRPFEGQTIPHFAHLIQNEKPIDPRKLDPNFPREIKKMLATMLKKNPDDRFDTARGVVITIDEFLRGDSKKTSIFDTVRLHLKPDWR